jgi:hypothetical protein
VGDIHVKALAPSSTSTARAAPRKTARSVEVLVDSIGTAFHLARDRRP